MHVSLCITMINTNPEQRMNIQPMVKNWLHGFKWKSTNSVLWFGVSICIAIIVMLFLFCLCCCKYCACCAPLSRFFGKQFKKCRASKHSENDYHELERYSPSTDVILDMDNGDSHKYGDVGPASSKLTPQRRQKHRRGESTMRIRSNGSNNSKNKMIDPSTEKKTSNQRDENINFNVNYNYNSNTIHIHDTDTSNDNQFHDQVSSTLTNNVHKNSGVDDEMRKEMGISEEAVSDPAPAIVTQKFPEISAKFKFHVGDSNQQQPATADKINIDSVSNINNDSMLLTNEKNKDELAGDTIVSADNCLSNDQNYDFDHDHVAIIDKAKGDGDGVDTCVDTGFEEQGIECFDSTQTDMGAKKVNVDDDASIKDYFKNMSQNAATKSKELESKENGSSKPILDLDISNIEYDSQTQTFITEKYHSIGQLWKEYPKNLLQLSYIVAIVICVCFMIITWD